MKYNLISMDFDGTLLTSDKKITKRNKEILQKYKNNNYIIVGVTARNFSSVNSVCNINMFDYVILNNGSYIYDVKNKCGDNIGFIEKEIAIKITDYFKNKAIEIDYCSLNNYYMYKVGKIENKKYNVKINDISEVKEIISRMNIFLKDNEEIDNYKKYIESHFENLSTFTMLDTDNNSNKKWISINPKETNKFGALEKLCFKLNIDISQIIFFGDSMNDIAIISKVGLGVAMGNALEEVKKQASKITLTNDQDGIAYFLEKNKI